MMQLIHVMILDVVVCRFSASFDISSDYQFDDDDDDDEYSDYCIEPSTSRDDMQSLQQDNDDRSLDNADCWNTTDPILPGTFVRHLSYISKVL